MDKVIYNGNTYEDDTLLETDCVIADALVSDELTVDTLTATVLDYAMQTMVSAAGGLPVAADGVLVAAKGAGATLDKSAEYGADVEYWHNDTLIGKFKLEDIVRTGKYQYKLSCVSAIGLLLTSDHYGGVYTGERMDAVLADIVGGIISYTVEDDLAATPIYGCLRKATRRDNLRDLLFAVGGQVRKDTLGELHIVPMTSGEPYEITADEFYMGGSVTGGNPASEVRVTEHSFLALPDDTLVTLYDGEAAAEEMLTPQGKAVAGVLVEFSEPMHDLTAERTEILESGPNYAVLSSSPAALLTGRQYTHTKRVLFRKQDIQGSPNVVTSDGCELVNLMNAELVTDRLMAYYGAAKTVEVDIVVTGQKPGDAVTFVDPFGDVTEGYIADMELTMSSIIKARTTLVSGYLPPGSGNYYTDVTVFTQDGVFDVGEDYGGKVRIVLVGGGDGGGPGNAGEDGGTASGSSYGASGKGGDPGEPGSGGKILVRTCSVAEGERYIIKIGKGGKGGTLDAEAQSGTPTTFGELSSEDGCTSESGVQDLINGDIYGTPGEEGLSGGKGDTLDEEGETVTHKGTVYAPGGKGEDARDGSYYGLGGYGGGAAAGADGGKGGDGEVDANGGNTFGTGGAGGKGAAPVKADDGKVPGQGGQAGHGGGGGGGGAPAKGKGDSYTWYGQGGKGGFGGDGGDGADGIALVYYRKNGDNCRARSVLTLDTKSTAQGRLPDSANARTDGPIAVHIASDPNTRAVSPANAERTGIVTVSGAATTKLISIAKLVQLLTLDDTSTAFDAPSAPAQSYQVMGGMAAEGHDPGASPVESARKLTARADGTAAQPTAEPGQAAKTLPYRASGDGTQADIAPADTLTRTGPLSQGEAVGVDVESAGNALPLLVRILAGPRTAEGWEPPFAASSYMALDRAAGAVVYDAKSGGKGVELT